jgi:hypothetical protein
VTWYLLEIFLSGLHVIALALHVIMILIRFPSGFLAFPKSGTCGTSGSEPRSRIPQVQVLTTLADHWLCSCEQPAWQCSAVPAMVAIVSSLGLLEGSLVHATRLK